LKPVASLGPRTLNGRYIALEPLEPRHHDDLHAAGSDTQNFVHVPPAGNPSNFDIWLGNAERAIARGERIAFAVRRLADGAIVGCTSYHEILPQDARVEIGGTWYTKEAQGGPVNPEAKLLLLTNAFDAGYNCVFLKTDARNARSRAAITKLGAKFDGILRGHIWREDAGYFRDSAYFSILASEWPDVRAGLEKRLA
jgi:RimJ/RimL family protein N-acetyltransferase